MAAKKRHISAKTRVKLSQASKRRKRGLKGTSLGGKFMAGAGPVFHLGASVKRSGAAGFGGQGSGGPNWSGGPGGGAPSPGSKPRKKRKQQQREAYIRKVQHGTSPGHVDEVVATTRQRIANKSEAEVRAELEFRSVRDQYNYDPNNPPDETAFTRRNMPQESKVTYRRSKDTQSQARARARRAGQQQHWREGDTFATTDKRPAGEFMGSTPEEMQSEVNNLMRTPNSPFTEGVGVGSEGSRKRHRDYVDQRQQGVSHQDALNHIAGKDPSGKRAERRGRKPSAKKKAAPTRGSKFESADPGGKKFEFGVSAGRAEKVQEVRDRVSGEIGDKDIIRIQQAQRLNLQDDLEVNANWAHETRRANILDEQGKMTPRGRKSKETEDRVVFFTTSLGGPAPSVPSDSLIGQYIIKRRGSMLKNAGTASSQLRGEFPRAVRDRHLIEFSTGLSYGVEGRHGVMKNTGWRVGKKQSRGYNKPTPLGSEILYGPSGQPMLDNEGRVRYSEGATRAFKYDTSAVGLKIFIG